MDAFLDALEILAGSVLGLFTLVFSYFYFLSSQTVYCMGMGVAGNPSAIRRCYDCVAQISYDVAMGWILAGLFHHFYALKLRHLFRFVLFGAYILVMLLCLRLWDQLFWPEI
jgi:hypothetical protein